MRLTKLLKPTIQDSHELVEYWMIRMNKEVGRSLKNKECGIFRQAIYKNDTNEKELQFMDFSYTCDNNFLIMFRKKIRSTYGTCQPD